MIDIKEIRIGNVLKYRNYIFKAKKISEDYSFSGEDIFPIPITEDLLSDLGFDEEVEDIIHRKYYRLRLNGFCIDINKYSNTLGRNYGIHIDNLCCDSVLSGDIQYLNQLQNYIYDSTKQELDVSMLLKK